MCRTKPWVAGGALVQVSVGDTCAPACVYFAGIWAPSGNDVDVSRIGGGAGWPPPPRCPPPAGACWAATAATITNATAIAAADRANRIAFLLSKIAFTR